ncbi:MAG: ABC transporter ATP-binding protein [Candidatus Limnocylindrales bacterium]
MIAPSAPDQQPRQPAEPGPSSPGAPAGATIAVATRGLAKSYGTTPALQGLDLSVPAGVVYGFLGPNGAGKTTTIRCLLGLIRPDGGQMELFGRPYSWRDRHQIARIGSLVESPSFYPYLSARDNLRVIASTGAQPPRGRVDELLELVGLSGRAGDRVSDYSLGMRQRLGIAAALLSDPEVLVLDEPANGLDPAGIVAMRETLRYLAGQGKTVFVSSHILPEVEQLADVVGIVDHGRVVRQGALGDLLHQTGHVRVRVAAADAPAARALLDRLAGSDSVWEESGQEGSDDWITVRVDPDRAGEVNRILAEAGIFATGLESGSDLEALFLSVTGVA